MIVEVLGAGGDRAEGDADSVEMQGSRGVSLQLGKRPLERWQQQGEARGRIS
jgi:hypothetical protein